MMAEEEKLHVVAFVLPFQGHFNPIFPFLVKMASMGVVVSAVKTEAAHAQVLKANAGRDPVVDARQTLHVDIRSLQVSDGLPLNFDRVGRREEYWTSVINDMPTHVENLVLKLKQQRSPPISCLLFDTLYVWSAPVAKKCGLPFASFFTESAAVFALYCHWDLLVEKGHLPFPETADPDQKLIDYIPGLPPLKSTDLPSLFQESDINTSLHKIIKRSCDGAKEAQWILSNTVDELESATVSALKEIGIPFLSIGPTLPLEFMDAESDGSTKKITRGTSMWEESDCCAWLDTKPKDSVVYISFGSFSQCSHNLVEEFAMGLLQSKLPFIWVLRPDVIEDLSVVEDVLPKEFFEGTKAQGMVVSWCGQLDVLRHPSVGGFVAHCGWNSTVEGLWVGVPMMGFPLTVDQYTNCWLISEQLDIAKSLGKVRCRRHGGISSREAVPRSEVATALIDFMTNEELRCQMKEKGKGLKQTMRDAVADNGSSRRNLQVFLDGISCGKTSHGIRSTTN